LPSGKAENFIEKCRLAGTGDAVVIGRITESGRIKVL
jgi:hypothetical protein